MKNFKRRLLSALLCLAVSIVFFGTSTIFAISEDNPQTTVYVSPDGVDSASGTREEPFATLKQAYRKLESSGGTIVIMGDIEKSNARAWNTALAAISKHSEMITITGKDPESGVIYKDAVLRHNSPAMKGPTKIEYLGLMPSRTYAFIDTCGHKFVIGNNITAASYEIVIHDGVLTSGVISCTDTTIDSGNITAYHLGGAYVTKEGQGVDGDCRLTINEGSIKNLYLGFDAFNDSHVEGSINGNIIIQLNGGKITEITPRMLLNSKVGGFISVVANNDTVVSKTTFPHAEEGVYFIRSSRGGIVKATDKAGVYTYETNERRYNCYVDGKLVTGGTFEVVDGEHSVFFSKIDKDPFTSAYVEGFPDGNFYPEQYLTRAEAIKLLLTAANEKFEKYSEKSSFSDIAASDWYYSAIAYAENEGFLPPEWQGSALPNKAMTRGEFVFAAEKILIRNVNSMKLDLFTDVSEEHPYYDEIISAIGKGCIEGYGDGTFRPEKSVTRAEAVTVINRFISRKPSASDSIDIFADTDNHWAKGQIETAATGIDDGVWVFDNGVVGESFTIPNDAKDASDYIPALYSASSYLSSEAIRQGVDEIAEKMKQDILSTPNTLEIYGDKITGNVYYISEKKGANIYGRGSKDKPFRSYAGLISYVTLKAGDAVLFERGGIYRGNHITTVSGVVHGAYGEGAKPIIMQSKKNYAAPDLWEETEWENVWKCTDLLVNVGVIGFDHDYTDYSSDTYDELYGIIMNKSTLGFDGVHELCKDLQFYSVIPDNSVSKAGELYLYSEKGNPGERFSVIDIGERLDIFDGSASNVVFDNLSLKFTGSHGIGFGDCKNVTVTNSVFSWIGGSVLRINADGSATNYGNAVEIYGSCSGYTVENNWMYQIYDTAMTHQRSTSVGDCIQENVRYAKNLAEYVFWGIEFYNSPPTKALLEQNGYTEDNFTRITRNVVSEYNLLRLGGYGWGSIVRFRGCLLYCGSTLSQNYDCYSTYNIFDRGYGGFLNLPSNSNEEVDKNIYIQHIGQPLGKLKSSTTTTCKLDAADRIKNDFTDDNAVVIVIDPVISPPERKLPAGLASSSELSD